jgi:signal transduction histidine kinase
LHDVVAHHVSVMGVQAGAARVVLDADPAAARTALGAIEQAARQAVDELHRLLGVLRAAPAGTPAGDGGEPPPDGPERAPTGTVAAAPAPGLDGLPDLVGATTATGLRVTYTVVGDPVPVPSGLSVSVYRIVQEALTNTVRHAGAARVDVRLRFLTDPAAIEAEIVDDGRSPAAPPVTGGERRRGLGLIGMRERAVLHDGELEVGPRPGGGFRVRARFPLRADQLAPARVEVAS